MNTFKLVSAKGTLLGTVTVPDGVAQYLNDPRRGDATMAAMERLPPMFRQLHELPAALVDIKQIHFRRSYHMRDAIEMWGMSPEEFEKLPGCSFSPGAGYLRSMITEGGEK